MSGPQVHSDQEASLFDQFIGNNLCSPENDTSNQQMRPRTSPRKRKLVHDPVPSPSFNTIKKAAVGSSSSVQDQFSDQYAENFRKLIVTARRQIKELQQKNEELEKRIAAGCILRCPGCLFTFNDNEHTVLPKYMRIFRPRRVIEMEFHSAELMDDYVTANRIGIDENGVPVQIPLKKPLELLEEVGSTLPQRVEEYQQAQSSGKVRIAIRKETKAQEKDPPPQTTKGTGTSRSLATLVIAEDPDVARPQRHKEQRRQPQGPPQKPQLKNAAEELQKLVEQPRRHRNNAMPQEQQRTPPQGNNRPQRYSSTPPEERHPPRAEDPDEPSVRELEQRERENTRALGQELSMMLRTPPQHLRAAPFQERREEPQRNNGLENGPQDQHRPVTERPQRRNTRPQEQQQPIVERPQRNNTLEKGPQEQQRPVTERPQRNNTLENGPQRNNAPPQEQQRLVTEMPQRRNATPQGQQLVTERPQRHKTLKNGPQRHNAPALEQQQPITERPQDQQQPVAVTDRLQHSRVTATARNEKATGRASAGREVPQRHSTVAAASANPPLEESPVKRKPAARKLECVQGRTSVFDRLSKPSAGGSSSSSVNRQTPAPVNKPAPPPVPPVQEKKTEEPRPSTLSTAEWRNAMSGGLFSNPSGVIGLEVPPGCVAPKKPAPMPSTSTAPVEKKVPPLKLRLPPMAPQLRRSPRKAPQAPPPQTQEAPKEQQRALPPQPPEEAPKEQQREVVGEKLPPKTPSKTKPKSPAKTPKNIRQPSPKTTPRLERYRNRTDKKKEEEERREKDGPSGRLERNGREDGRGDRRRSSRDEEKERSRSKEAQQRGGSRQEERIRDARQVAQEHESRLRSQRSGEEDRGRQRREEERVRGGRDASRGRRGLRSRDDERVDGRRERQIAGDSRPVDPNRRSARRAAGLPTTPDDRIQSNKRLHNGETPDRAAKRACRERASKSPKKVVAGKKDDETSREDGEIRSDEETDNCPVVSRVSREPSTTVSEKPKPSEDVVTDEGAESDTIDVYEDMVPIEDLRKAAALPPLEESKEKEEEMPSEASMREREDEEQSEQLEEIIIIDPDGEEYGIDEREKFESSQEMSSTTENDEDLEEENESPESEGADTTLVASQELDETKDEEEEDEESISGDFSIDEDEEEEEESDEEEDLASQLAMSDSEGEGGNEAEKVEEREMASERSETAKKEDQDEVESSSEGENSEGPSTTAALLADSNEAKEEEEEESGDDQGTGSARDEGSERLSPPNIAPQLPVSTLSMKDGKEDEEESSSSGEEDSEAPSTSGVLNSSEGEENEDDEVSGSIRSSSSEDEEVSDEAEEDDSEGEEPENEKESYDEKIKPASPKRQDTGSSDGGDDFSEWGEIVYNEEDVLSDSFVPDEDEEEV